MVSLEQSLSLSWLLKGLSWLGEKILVKMVGRALYGEATSIRQNLQKQSLARVKTNLAQVASK